MIWFSCKHCGQTHGRPEAAMGATIFCACGQGVMVPWESTAAEPPAIADPAPVLQLEPVTFDAVPARPGPTPRGRSNSLLARRDPERCFNHDAVAKHANCVDCGESFCGDCLVSFDSVALCGPCKNQRVRILQRGVPPSNLSILSMLTALLSAPVTLALLPLAHAGFPWWTLVALVPQGLAACLAILALRRSARDPKAAGGALALIGLVSAGVTGTLLILLAMYVPHVWT